MTDLRDDALAVLRGWEPVLVGQADRQRALRDRYVAHLEEHPDGTTRGCRPDHVTASTLVLSHDGSQVLLTLHAKAGRWFQLGGHCEAGDTTLAGAAAREALEESGLATVSLREEPVHLDEHAVPFCGTPVGPDEPAVHHLDVRFVAVAPADAVPEASEESLDVRWWPADRLPDDELVPLVEAAQSALSRSGGGWTRAASDQPSR